MFHGLLTGFFLILTFSQASFAQEDILDGQPGSVLSSGSVFTTVNEKPIVFPSAVDSLFFKAGGQKSTHLARNENGDSVTYSEALAEPYCAITRKNKKDNQLISKDRKIQVSSSSVHSAACIRVSDIKNNKSFLCVAADIQRWCVYTYSDIFVEAGIACRDSYDGVVSNATVTKIHFEQSDKTFGDLECYQKRGLARELTVGEIKTILEGTFKVSIPALKPASVIGENTSDSRLTVDEGALLKAKEVGRDLKQGSSKKETPHKKAY